MWTHKRNKGGLGLESSFERFVGGGTSDVARQLVPRSELTEKSMAALRCAISLQKWTGILVGGVRK